LLFISKSAQFQATFRFDDNDIRFYTSSTR
jgi:hypothetical protein